MTGFGGMLLPVSISIPSPVHFIKSLLDSAKQAPEESSERSSEACANQSAVVIAPTSLTIKNNFELSVWQQSVDRTKNTVASHLLGKLEAIEVKRTEIENYWWKTSKDTFLRNKLSETSTIAKLVIGELSDSGLKFEGWQDKEDLSVTLTPEQAKQPFIDQIQQIRNSLESDSALLASLSTWDRWLNVATEVVCTLARVCSVAIIGNVYTIVLSTFRAGAQEVSDRETQQSQSKTLITDVTTLLIRLVEGGAELDGEMVMTGGASGSGNVNREALNQSLANQTQILGKGAKDLLRQENEEIKAKLDQVNKTLQNLSLSQTQQPQPSASSSSAGSSSVKEEKWTEDKAKNMKEKKGAFSSAAKALRDGLAEIVGKGDETNKQTDQILSSLITKSEGNVAQVDSSEILEQLVEELKLSGETEGILFRKGGRCWKSLIELRTCYTQRNTSYSAEYLPIYIRGNLYKHAGIDLKNIPADDQSKNESFPDVSKLG